MFRSASLFIGTSFTVVVFTIFATSNVDSIVRIPHKIYSMPRILIHIKADLFVICAHLHPGCAANLVVRSRYYHCHWTVLGSYFQFEEKIIQLFKGAAMRIFWDNKVTTIATDVLAPCVARPSAVMLLTMQYSVSLSSARKDSNYLCHLNTEKW